ncbi:MAG: alpha-L-fucosidase [Akkermansiaceae bacterium]|nr:alpha-L-fucosidase [Akkermansiaceae bacterium]
MTLRPFAICALSLLAFPFSANGAPLSQRADSSVIMPADTAVDGKLIWEVVLNHPGTYVLQVVVELNEATGEISGTFYADSKPLGEKLEKQYIIEDGLVAEFSDAVTFEAGGVHTLTLKTEAAVKYARLVPQGYVKSRISLSSGKYYDEWLKMHESPEKVAAMEWYKQARFGMFIHWGVYSKAAGIWKGKRMEEGDGPRVAEWVMNSFKISREEYRDYAKNFNPDKSFATNIAKLAKDTGMKYVVITSKHHDGFGLFDSAHSDFDIADSTDYEGDLIKELYDACRTEGLDFGVYYSHGNDWTEGGDGNYANVLERDKQYGVSTRPNGKNLWDPSPNTHLEYLENKAYLQVAELIKLLPDLRLIWFDGEGLITEEQAFRFYKMVYELNPGIVVNRRVGYDFGDYVDAGDNKTPAANELAAKHFETCGTANHSWGFKEYDHDWKTPHELLRNFVDIVSKGGNYLLNIGPDGKGKVPDECVASFAEMGEWVKTNSEAIFGNERWTVFNEGIDAKSTKEPKATEFWFSSKGEKVYAMSLAPNSESAHILSLGNIAGEITAVRLLGSEKELNWTQTDDALQVDFKGIETGNNGYALEVTLGK